MHDINQHKNNCSDVKLSIIVPVHNKAKNNMINRCVESLLSQKGLKIEIILVDDASTDNSVDILYEYQNKYFDIIKVINLKENINVGGARNVGLKVAKGEWISFVDSDDWVEQSMFKTLIDAGERDNSEIVGCDITVSYDDMSLNYIIGCNSVDQTGILDLNKYKSLILNGGGIIPKIYRKEIFDRFVERFPEKICFEDNAFVPLILLNAKKFSYVDNAMYHYYQNLESIVHTIDIKKIHDRIVASDFFFEWVSKYNYLEKFNDEITYYYIENYYVMSLMLYLRSKNNNYHFYSEINNRIVLRFPDYKNNKYFKMEKKKKKYSLLIVSNEISNNLGYLLSCMHKKCYFWLKELKDEYFI